MLQDVQHVVVPGNDHGLRGRRPVDGRLVAEPTIEAVGIGARPAIRGSKATLIRLSHPRRVRTARRKGYASHSPSRAGALLNQKPLATRTAFDGLLGTLHEISEQLRTGARGLDEEVDAVEGFRNALHLLSVATDCYLEGDPERPAFLRLVSPTRKMMGDNPDAIYHFARLRGDRRYRVTGRRGDCAYLSFTVHGRAEDGRLGAAAEPALADVNDRGMRLAEDGSFEVILAAERPAGATNWIPLSPTAASLIVRHYWERETSVAADAGARVDLAIEPLDPPGVRPPIDDAGLAARIRDVNAYLRGTTLDMVEMSALPLPFVSRTPNELPTPTIFRTAGQASWGAVDIAYAMAPYRLEDDEALVMEGRFPACAYASVVLWNRHMQCLEYRDRPSWRNRANTKTEADGSYRMVIAHRDPGVANWLDTEGHRDGTIFWRFLLPQGEIEKPRCRLVPLAELAR